jgi:hypothetical protein
VLDETLGSFCPIIASMAATVVEMLPSSGWGHTSRDLSICSADTMKINVVVISVIPDDRDEFS